MNVVIYNLRIALIQLIKLSKIINNLNNKMKEIKFKMNNYFCNNFFEKINFDENKL